MLPITKIRGLIVDNQSGAILWIINGIISTGALLLSCEYIYKKYKKRWIKIVMIGIIIVTIFSILMQILNFPQ